VSIFPAGIFGLPPIGGGSVIGTPSFLTGLPLGLGYSVLPAGAVTISDDGGETIQITGPFGNGDACTVAINGVACFSGIFGQGATCIATNGIVTAVTPADLPAWQVIGPNTVPYGGPYDVTVTLPTGVIVTIADAVIVVRRNRRTETYDLARRFPPPVYAPGPTLLDSGPLLAVGADVPARVSATPAFVSALGQTFNDSQGLIFTRLVADLPPALLGTSPGAAAFIARVETVYGFPAALGTVVINGEIIGVDGGEFITGS
jgi:hypothetical protein